MEENIFKIHVERVDFKFSYENRQKQVGINTFPGLFPFSSTPACGIIISAMVFICTMVFNEPSVQTNRSVCLITTS